MKKKKALIVEDIPEHATLVEISLGLSTDFEFEADAIDNVPDAIGQVMSRDYDIAIIDRQLKGLDGLDIVRTMRKYGKDTPVIILTCMGSDDDELEGRKLKVDDYKPKPIKPELFVMCVEAVLRRYDRSKAREKIELGDVTVSTGQRKVFRRGVEIELEPMEYKVLEFIANNRGTVVKYDEIAWGAYGYEVNDNHTIQVCVSEFCKKINRGFPKEQAFTIENIRSEGYVIR